MKKEPITSPIVYTATRLEAIANKYVFQPMGMTSASIKILGLLCKKGPASPSVILRLIGGTKSNVSQRLDFLEKKGYINRVYGKSKEDRRQVAVVLTASGKEKISEAMKYFNKAQLSLEKYFSKEELEGAYAFFDKINKILDREEDQMAKIFNQAK